MNKRLYVTFSDGFSDSYKEDEVFLADNNVSSGVLVTKLDAGKRIIFLNQVMSMRLKEETPKEKSL